MYLVFIHGMRQEGRLRSVLRADWEAALTNAWKASAMPIPDYQLEMPFYGEELDALTRELRGPAAGRIVARGGVSEDVYTDLEATILRQLAQRAGATDSDVLKELGQDVTERGALSWERVQATLRWLSKNAPWLAERALRLARQVDAYLDRPHVQKAVDAIVGPALSRGPSVVVAHSLGTVVSYRLLREYGTKANIKLFVTLGSPLGINAIKARLQPPSLKVPEGVTQWLNGADPRDYVALYPTLDASTFAANIINFNNIRNGRGNPHSILDYLSDRRISECIAKILGECQESN